MCSQEVGPVFSGVSSLMRGTTKEKSRSQRCRQRRISLPSRESCEQAPRFENVTSIWHALRKIRPEGDHRAYATAPS